MKIIHEDYVDVTVKKSREQKTYPITSHKIWCFGCDAYQLNLTEKCPHCGFKYKTKHRKK